MLMNTRTIQYSLIATAISVVLAVGTHAIADDATDVWNVDESRSSITFTSEAPAEKIVGTSEEVTGSVQWNRQSPARSTGKLSFPVDSMRTGNSLRDRHLTEEDWLGADENPDVIFTLEKIKDLETARSDNRIDYRGTAVGKIELNGVEQPNEASVQIAVLPERKLARIQPEISFRLADHNVKGADGAIGSEVGKVIEVEGLIYANWD